MRNVVQNYEYGLKCPKTPGMELPFFTKILNFAVEKSNGCRKEA